MSPGWPMFEDKEELIRQRLYEMRLEHSDLDDMIRRATEDLYVNQIQLRRLKKRKLQLKDAIERLRSELIPDLDA
jgi:hypothetical protein